MKNNYLIFLLLLTLFSVSSCIQDEAPNAECDIVSVDAAWLERNKDIIIGNPVIDNNYVKFYVLDDNDIKLEDLKKLEPKFNLTVGARIEKIGEPTANGENGIMMQYRTFSEDGKWWKNYDISFVKQVVIPIGHVFSFEEYTLNKVYCNKWNETINNTNFDWWTSGNGGFVMTGQGKKPEDFPTSSYEDGFKGKCIKLKTCDTGAYGKKMGMPIAAGNIFMGEFKLNNPKEALKATKMGLQIVPTKPASLTGYYKYTPGEVFTDAEKNEVPARRDECAIYAVLYEANPENFVALDGSNITSSDRIVLIAELQNPGEPAEWTEFNIPFEPRNGKKFDYNKLANNEYAITVVASSSKDGAFFEGAVGSTLFVDEIKIEWENK